MKVIELAAVAALLAGCSASTVPEPERSAGGSPAQAQAGPAAAGQPDTEAGAGGQPPTEAQDGGAGGEAGQAVTPEGGQAGGDAGPTTDEAGAGGEAGAQSAGPAPGKLWGHCNVDPQSPDPRVLCDDPANSCWQWLDPADLALKNVCAPTCDSLQEFAVFGRHPTVSYGLDYALKQQCEQQLGGECGPAATGSYDACFPPRPE